MAIRLNDFEAIIPDFGFRLYLVVALVQPNWDPPLGGAASLILTPQVGKPYTTLPCGNKNFDNLYILT